MVYTRFPVESLITAKRSPKKNPYITDPNEKCNNAKNRLLITIPAFTSTLLYAPRITPLNTNSSTTAGTTANTTNDRIKGYVFTSSAESAPALDSIPAK